MSKVVFQDHIGRVIVGTLIDTEDASTITVENPVVIHTEMSQTGGISVHTIPVLFAEMIEKDQSGGTKNTWTYPKSSIVISDVTLNSDMLQKIERINTLNNPEEEVDDNVISIDDVE